MASTPKCLQNPRLRLVKIGRRFVTVERVKSAYKDEPAYDVYYEGAKIGNVWKLRSYWYAGPCRGTRQECISHILNNYIIAGRK